MGKLSSFIKYQRKKLTLTQKELAAKAGVGIRFIRELEQGKETLQLNKVNEVLALFGFSLSPDNQKIDAYDIFWNYFNKAVKITLTNRVIKYGIIIKEITDKKSNKISAWQFVSNNNAIKYQQKPDDNLTEIILHNDIQTIEEQ
ncbi:MAG: transcriptional regulator [Bacteroidetes bacterium]|nr:MAG: transcriptional regulator [Bacteroidota bacterium]